MKKNRRIAWLSLGVACMFSCFSCYGEQFRGKSRFASDLLATEESWVTADPEVAVDRLKGGRKCSLRRMNRQSIREA